MYAADVISRQHFQDKNRMAEKELGHLLYLPKVSKGASFICLYIRCLGLFHPR